VKMVYPSDPDYGSELDNNSDEGDGTHQPPRRPPEARPPRQESVFGHRLFLGWQRLQTHDLCWFVRHGRRLV
jgi:hypothetical protein